MPDDFEDELRRIEQIVGTGEPPELRSSYLSVPDPRRLLFTGTTVPLIGPPMMQRADGLVVPAQGLADRVLALGRRFMTAVEVFGQEIPAELARYLIGGHPTEEILAGAAVLMAQLYEEAGPVSPRVQRFLVETYLQGDARRNAEARLADGTWAFLAPQAVLGVMKVALMLGDSPLITRPPTHARGDAVAGALALARHLGAHPDDGEPERRIGTIPEASAIHLMANQLFNHSIDLGTALARWHRTRQLAREYDAAAFARYDQIFLEATGTTPDVLFDVGMTILLQQSSAHSVVIDTKLLDQLVHPSDQVGAAVRLFATNKETLGQEVQTEIDRQGFDWSFNAMRHYPVLVKENEELLILAAPFLIERICGSAYFWEVRTELNQRREAGGPGANEARTLLGGFGGFAGHVAEEYVVDRLNAVADDKPGIAKVLWRESELQEFWPGMKCCDILIDLGHAWLAIDVVSSRLSEGAAEGCSPEALEKDLQIIVDEKALQLDRTISRLIENGGALPGHPPRAQAPRYYPMIVASNGFPWNPIVALEMKRRLEGGGLLQHALIDQLTVVDTDGVEHLESAVVRGVGTLGGLLRERAERGEEGTPLDHLLHRKAQLRRPASLRRPMVEAFRQTGEALGFDSSLIGDTDESDTPGPAASDTRVS